MTMICRMLVLLAMLSGLAAAADTADRQLAATLKGVVETNVRTYNAKDAGGVLGTVHTKSPEYESTGAAIAEQFREVPVTAQLTDFRYIGHDDEFAVARMKIKLAGPPTHEFADNVVDSVELFHQEGGTWKLWADEVLGVEFVAFTPH